MLGMYGGGFFKGDLGQVLRVVPRSRWARRRLFDLGVMLVVVGMTSHLSVASD